jgi:hypothetical protein
MNESEDEQARREQAQRWREQIEEAKSGKQRPPASPREFTDPSRHEKSADEGDEADG